MRDGAGRGPREMAVFVRDYHPPGPLETTPGQWRVEEWPISRTRWTRLYPSKDRRLRSAPGGRGRDLLAYVPDCGTAADQWWADPMDDMSRDDACSLVYDSGPLKETVEIIGSPRVLLLGGVDTGHAHWVARLEDVAPDGRVTHVTGAALNGAQRNGRQEPSPWPAGEARELAFELHFTTWTFRPGHRIRLAVASAQFPMIWPVEGPMTTTLDVGVESTRLELPTVPYGPRPELGFPPPEPRAERADARELASGGWPARHQVVRDRVSGTTAVEWYGDSRYEVRDRRHRQEELTIYRTLRDPPARASFHGDASHLVEWAGRTVRLRTRMDVKSDGGFLDARVRRQIFENDRLVREKLWRERIPRGLR